MLGKRKYFRIKKNFHVNWTVIDHPFAGEAKVVNMSITGMNVLINTHFPLSVGFVLFLEVSAHEVSLNEARKAKIVWIKKSEEGSDEGMYCGLEFIEDNGKDKA